MAYSNGEVAGLAAAVLAIGAVGLGITVFDSSPHLGAAPAASASRGAPSSATPSTTTARLSPVPGANTSAGAVAPAPATPAPAEPALVIRRILPIEGPIRYGEWHWDEAGVPARGALVITVDLEARVISVFRDGYEIGAAAVLLGTQEKPTPTGVFPITEKDAHHVSNLYDAPMPYMLRLTNDGVTIHATTVANGYASHGCIGVPRDFARKLFGAAQLGDRVYITRGKHVGLGDKLT